MDFNVPKDRSIYLIPHFSIFKVFIYFIISKAPDTFFNAEHSDIYNKLRVCILSKDIKKSSKRGHLLIVNLLKLVWRSKEVDKFFSNGEFDIYNDFVVWRHPNDTANYDNLFKFDNCKN